MNNARSTWTAVGVMALLLAAAAAWRWYTQALPDPDAPISDAPYHHDTQKTAPPPPLAAGQESFRFTRAREKVKVADTRMSVDELPAEHRQRFGLPKSTDVPFNVPAVIEEMIHALPAPAGTPKLQKGRPQLIPKIEDPGGVPEESTTTPKQP